jgi:hypothetical protein
MSIYKLDAVYEIRKHLWAELVDKGIFDPEEYYSENIGQELIPILPVQQQPELNQFLSGKKHIIFDKIGSSYNNLWTICDEKIMFTIYAINVDEITEIRNLIVDVFRRMDDSAKDLNIAGYSNKFKYHNVLVLDISPTAPSAELQGFFAADIVLEVKYSRVTDPSGRFN